MNFMLFYHRIFIKSDCFCFPQNFGSAEAWEGPVVDLFGGEDKKANLYSVSLDDVREQLLGTEDKGTLAIKSIYKGGSEEDKWLVSDV